MVKKIIKISNNRVYLNPEVSFAIEDTNLHQGDVKFSTSKIIYWEVEFDNNPYNTDRSLSITVSNYYPANTKGFETQEVTGVISRLRFAGLKWEELEKQAFTYKKDTLIRLGIAYETSPQGIANGGQGKRSNSFDRIPVFSTPPAGFTAQPVIHGLAEYRETKEVSFDFHYADTIFKTGQACFIKKFTWCQVPIDFTIENDWLRPEYNHIKSYFEKALGNRKTFTVTATVQLVNGRVTGTIARSEQIDLITPGLIDRIKHDRTMGLLAKPSGSAGRTLYTETDIYGNFDEAGEKDVFKQSGKDILDYILHNKVVRNSQQLQYLSQSLHNSYEKIRFTLSPLFGFLFYIVGRERNFFCWELLNSHATYLWAFDGDAVTIHEFYDKVEKELNYIEINGRENYRKQQKNSTDADMPFFLLEHVGEGDQGFENWKLKLHYLIGIK